MPRREPADLVPRLRAGDRVALARALTLVERGGDDARRLDGLLADSSTADNGTGPGTGSHGATSGTAAAGLDRGPARVVGVTGPPGGGKSALVDAMIGEARGRGRRVAVLAVDPSSSRTGGALLGDRVRMGSRAGDEGVVIRSLASRGSTGGLAVSVPGAVRVVEAAGFDEVLIETVGVGQVELDIATATDVTVLVTPPGLGDTVQAAKAGLIEVADVCVVTKADRPGAQTTARELRTALDMADRPSTADGTRPPIPVVLTTAGPVPAQGIDELWDAIDRFSTRARANGTAAVRRLARRQAEIVRLATDSLQHRLQLAVGGAGYRPTLDALDRGEVDPWEAAAVLERLIRTT